MVSRDAECAAVARFLDAATREPSSLLIEGEAGIGKTTIWLAGVEQARERDFHVLATRPAQTESVLSYVALADLLSRVDAGQPSPPATTRIGPGPASRGCR